MSIKITCEWYLSNKKLGVGVETEYDEKKETHIIIAAAPVVRAFIGQPLSNLERWMKTDAILLDDD